MCIRDSYYGGIKKYQWTAIPLSIHGVIVKTNGEKIRVNIGEDEKDPVFTITDLLPHLAQEQMEKKMKEGILIDFQITNDDIAGFCGISTRNSVSRILCELKKEGVIKIVNQKILILDIDYLKQYVQC